MAQGTKSAAATAVSQSSRTAANGDHTDNGAPTTSVNRKKQKRREKLAAKMAAEQGRTGVSSPGHDGDRAPSQANHRPGSAAQDDSEYVNLGINYEPRYEPADGDVMYFSDEEGQIYRGQYDPDNVNSNGHALPNFLNGTDSIGKKSKKRRKAKGAAVIQQGDLMHARGGNGSLAGHSALHVPPPPPPPPPLATHANRSGHTISRDRIWNTSTQEERERIKEFWLSLGEEDRRSLVKVEKEAVLRKMKEQQKHSCSCTVCGRKRTAIEEELEVLYDAYYEELEQYANHQQASLENGTPMIASTRRFGPTARMQTSGHLPPMLNARSSSASRVEELGEEEDDEDDEDYSDGEDDEEEDDEDYSDDEPEEEPRGPAADFFNFGNSLTVQGGILTVADDLLKNDGKKFIEMMEQLAERRMQREEEAQYAASGLAHPSLGLPGGHSHAGHNHPPQPEEDDYDEDEDEDFDSQDEDYDDDEMDSMTEEQRMEEGRRMFQIFAARMFEQRVLTAYREKVAQERQRKLLEELEEETKLDAQRELKKAKEAQKKKDKKRQQKQAKDEEKARKEAEKAAEDAAARAVEEKKLEEARQRKEEQRKKREAERKAAEDERLRKEAEKQRRLQEERERHAEAERKQRELKEREKKKREEVKKKEREERELKEKEARDKKEREEKTRRDKIAKSKADKEARDAKEIQARREEHAAQQAAAQAAQAAAHAVKRPPQPSAVPVPPGLQASLHPAVIQSPHLQIATPVIPKAPTPMRPRQPSQQESVQSSPRTPQLQGQTSPSNATSQQSSPGPVGPPGKMAQPGPYFHPQVAPSSIAPPPGMPLSPAPIFPGAYAMGMNGMPPSQPGAMPNIAQRGQIRHDAPPFMSQQAPIGTQSRPYNGPNVPGFHANTSMASSNNLPARAAPGRDMFLEGVQGLPQPLPQQQGGMPPALYGAPRDTMPSHSHSRQHSINKDTPFDNIQAPAVSQPIARPAPIQRPSSATRFRGDDGHQSSKVDVDDLSNHLGSSALLDDTDDQTPQDASSNRRGSAAPGPPPGGPGRSRFFGTSMFPNPLAQTTLDGLGLSTGANTDSWAAPHLPFGSTNMPGASTWSNNPGPGWSNPSAFGIIGGHNRPSLSRPVSVRLLICQACKQLTSTQKPGGGDGFHDINNVLRQVEKIRSASDSPVQMREMLEICETEGDAQNGGGVFTIKSDAGGRTLVRHEGASSMSNLPLSARGGGGGGGFDPGEIGSPISGSAVPFGGARPFAPQQHQQQHSSLTSPSGF